MAGISSTLAIFAVFLVFYPIPTSSTPSSELISKNYAQIAQYFGFPSPKLPNISFAKISKQCREAVEKLNTSELVLYLDAFGKPPNGLFLGNIGWLGSYSECTKFIAGAHYCLAFIETPFVKDFSTRWGICVPKQCSEEDVTNALQDIYKISGVVKLSPQKIDDAAYKPVFCNKKPEYTNGVIMTLVLCGAILFLCLVGTIVDIAVSFAKSDSLPLNADDGFISIKGVSTAADQTIHDTERMSLLQSSAEANHKECAILSRHQQEPVLPNVVVRFFLCFSLIQNINGIMDTKVPPSAISSIHGIRVLSMWWVILGHTYYFVLYFPMIISGNFRMILGVMQRFTFQAVANGTYSVDSFFLLSGLLVSYLSLGRMEKKKGKLALFQYYFHRFCRLTPTYMFVLLFMHKLGNFLSEGPLWHPEITEYRCRKYWWTNLLYINNFYPTSFEDQCMGWGWYLANDMQFYIISPAILFTAYRFRLRGLLVSVGGLMSISFITTAILFAHYHIGQPVTAKQIADDSSLVYEKPYCRIAPYLVGMVLGYILIHSKNWKLPAKVCTYLFNIAGWSVAISLALSTLYGKYKTVRKNPEPFSRTENITYGTFSRFAWSLALAWVIFACHRGLGGLVNKILSAGFWVPLSRLTYCAYLVHPIVILVHYGSFETVQAYSDVHFAFHFVSFVAMSYGAAFIVSLCVECPMMQLEKLIFKSDH